MNSLDDTDLNQRLHAALDLMPPSERLDERVRHALSERATRPPRRRPARRFAWALVALGVVTVFTATLVTGLGLRGHQSTSPGESVFGGGPPAIVGPDARTSFVWLFDPETRSSVSTPTATKIIAEDVDVIDWTGALRYRFQLPGVSLGPYGVQSISPDGRRALMSDGTVLDETGAAVGHIPAPASFGPYSTGVRWATDDTSICEAVSNEPHSPPAGSSSKGATDAPASASPLPQWAQPGADHSVTLDVVGLDGQAKAIATVGAGALDEPSGMMPDSTSVLTCNLRADVAVIARYRGALGPSSARPTADVWAIRISTGQVLFHQLEIPMASGRAFFFGSQLGNLAVEFLWNSTTAGSEVDRVVRIPSGESVPVTDAEPVPDTPAVNADGTRILRRLLDSSRKVTTLELLNASDGSVIRRFELPGLQGAQAAPEAHGKSFLMQVDGQLVVIDQEGRTTVLHPPFTVTKGNTIFGVSMSGVPGLQG